MAAAQTACTQVADPSLVFVRDRGAMTRDEFRSIAGPDTIVFDTLAERLGDVRGGRWERRAGESWHARLLAARATG